METKEKKVSFLDIVNENANPDIKSEGKQEEAKPEVKEVIEETPIKETKKEPEVKKEVEVKKEEVITEKKEEEKVIKNDKKDSEKEEEKVEEENPFDIKDKVEQKAEDKIDWKSYAKELDIEIEDNSKDAYIQAVNKRIDEAREEVKYDISHLPKEAQEVIENLENGVSLEDYIVVDGKFDKFLALSDEKKAISYLKYDNKFKNYSEEELNDYVQELKEDGQLSELVEKTINPAVIEEKNKAREERITQSRGRHESFMAEDNKRVEKERKELISEIENTKDFFGSPVPKESINYIISQIRNGRIFEKTNNAKTQAKALLFAEFGDKIMAWYDKKVKDASRETYNSVKKQEQSSRHNIPPVSSSGSHSKENSDKKATPKDLFEE